MALHFVAECDMTRYIVVCCVVAGHDKHDMAWRVVARREMLKRRALCCGILCSMDSAKSATGMDSAKDLRLEIALKDAVEIRL